MSSDDRNDDGMKRRDFMMAGAMGAAGIVATAAASSDAAAAPMPPDPKKLRTNSPSGKRVAIVTDTQLNMGPYIAKEFAKLGYGLVIADVQKGLEKELKDLGAYKVVVVPGIEQEAPNDEGRPGVIQTVVDAAMKEFGGYDSVFIRTAWHGGKNILEETPENMQLSYEQNCMAVFYALRAVLPPLAEAGGGQVVV